MSGEPSSPTENECNLGHQASSVSPDSILLNRCRAAIAAMREESRPPDINTPYGTSHISCCLTAASSAVRNLCKATFSLGTVRAHTGSYHLTNFFSFPV